MKLLVAGPVLLAAAVAVLLADLNAAPLFIIGGVCTFVGVINLIAPPGTGVAVSASSMNEAERLANLQTYGSADRSAQFIDRP